MGRLKKLLVLLLAALSGGCTGEVDFCELLSVQEAQTLDSSIESKRMATFDDKSNYCVYSNGR